MRTTIITTEVSTSVTCNKCGRQLCSVIRMSENRDTAIAYVDKIMVSVVPCPNCMAREFKYGQEAGKLSMVQP